MIPAQINDEMVLPTNQPTDEHEGLYRDVTLTIMPLNDGKSIRIGFSIFENIYENLLTSSNLKKPVKKAIFLLKRFWMKSSFLKSLYSGYI